jgi:hypothetical protein
VGPVGEPAQPDLRPLQVGQDPDGPTRRLSRIPDVPVDLLVVGMGAVAEIQPGNIHAGVHEATDALGTGGGRAKGTNDLRTACHVT